MKPTRQIHDPYHNPFQTQFNVPVHSRLDEMQAFTQMVWLKEPAASDQDAEKRPHSRPWGRALAAGFALVLVLIFSATLLSN